MSQVLMRASQQWASRPADERFLDLDVMLADQQARRERSTQKAISSRRLECRAVECEDEKGQKTFGDLVVLDKETNESAAPTHWAFNQLSQLAGAPPKYLRSLPTPIVQDCINWGLRFNREIKDVGIMTRKPVEFSNVETRDEGMSAAEEYAALMAATGPNYGRVWNYEIVENVRRVFGNGRDGAFRIPGEFGKDVPITKQNTTLYAGDRDCFIFLADEKNKIEIPDRRNGEPGFLSRGFFVWNSEVGSTSLGVAMFLFDYACLNRMVWGTLDYQEVRIRHTASAPDKFVDEIAPALLALHDRPAGPIVEAVKKAKAARITDDVNEWLSKRYSARNAALYMALHEEEEGRPIETLYDVSTAITAYARGVNWQDDRVALEREAGKVFELAQ